MSKLDRTFIQFCDLPSLELTKKKVKIEDLILEHDLI